MVVRALASPPFFAQGARLALGRVLSMSMQTPEGISTRTNTPKMGEDVARTLRGRCEDVARTLRGRCEDVARTLRGRCEDVARTLRVPPERVLTAARGRRQWGALMGALMQASARKSGAQSDHRAEPPPTPRASSHTAKRTRDELSEASSATTHPSRNLWHPPCISCPGTILSASPWQTLPVLSSALPCACL